MILAGELDLVGFRIAIVVEGILGFIEIYMI